MEQINKKVEFSWEKEIEIKLSLWELQMIRDGLGLTSHDMRKGSFMNHATSDISNPYETHRFHNSYLELQKILKENGGVTI